MSRIRAMLRVTVASKSESTTRGMIKFAPTEFQDVETCVFVYTLPPAVVLAVSPLLLGGITILTITWTFAYARRTARRGAEIDEKE